MGVSSIEWTDRTWSPIRARVRADAPAIARSNGWADLVPIVDRMVGHVGPHCEQVSPGCHNCYSKTNNHRRLPSNGTGLPFDRRSRELVEIFIDEKILSQPLSWRKPCKVFVENQSDLFGEFVPTELIDQVFAVMSLSPHTFQILTKRPERMLGYCDGLTGRDGGKRLAAEILTVNEVYVKGLALCGRTCRLHESLTTEGGDCLPLPNVWLGVSCEDQKTADERIPLLLQTPAAVRFVSAEPLLGPIDFGFQRRPTDDDYRGWGGDGPIDVVITRRASDIHWLIVGGESGPKARPCNVEWVRSIVGQCRAASVPAFVKQLGAYVTDRNDSPMNGEGINSWPSRSDGSDTWFEDEFGYEGFQGDPCRVFIESRKGGDPAEWPADLRVRRFPGINQ